uniref:Uncharacterized protein n=1 Tax=Monotropa hypopitys TaxID=176248 RepID=A0A140G123_9ERIC|nr:hypothetical protein MHYP1_040 [Monotropa hypopitys]AMM04618.1 hypothetical protein MHYP1_040 [Monotropa hypopitys]
MIWYVQNKKLILDSTIIFTKAFHLLLFDVNFNSNSYLFEQNKDYVFRQIHTFHLILKY